MTPVADRQEEESSTAGPPVLVQPWPQGVSREPVMRISDVLAQLGGDFPALTPSKLRFLEEQGLVEPRRTAGGYRQYSAADVERLRFVLRQQRDRYLPLRVIGGQLAALDAGTSIEPLVPRLVATAGERTTPAVAGRYTVAAMTEETGVAAGLIAELIDSGVLRVDRSGHLDGWALEVVRVAGALSEHGVEPRHLRPVRSAVDREIAIADQVAAPLRGQRAVAAHAHASAVAQEIGELFARLHAALVRAGVDELGH